MRKYAFLAAFFCYAFGAFGQVTFGLRAGVAGSMFLGESEVFSVTDGNGEEVTTGYKLGYQAALYARIPVSEGFNFRPELSIAEIGSVTRDVFFPPFDAKFQNNFTYLSLPLLAELGASDNLSILIGPQVSYLLTARRRLENIVDEYDDLFDPFAKARRFNVGGVLGLHYEFESGFNFGLRGEYFILSSFEAGQGGEAPSVNHLVVNLSVGYTFDLLNSNGQNYRKGKTYRR